ncbi:hypothetical protein BJY00DRAFT_323757 [Aspergillus carlsbadensis]|nr:hypothetical protein BJY00DRAFT_323757 [Aspergillus carlsbadensis]
MDFDDISLATFNNLQTEWFNLCSRFGPGICQLADHRRQRDDCFPRSMHRGSFNFSIRLHWEDGKGDWLIRFPIPGKSMFLEEKVDTLNPNMDPDVLKRAYSQMAGVLTSLWSLDFDKIGSLREGTTSGEIVIDGPPLTQEVNELIRASGIQDPSPQRTYHSSTDYIKSLLDLQSIELEQQRNSVYDSEDCRNKYACRQLMKAIALNFIPRNDDGPFKLFCDDFGPGNVLVNDECEIVAVIDWEFCYAVPPQFAASIPWWILLRRPDYIVDDIGPDLFFDTLLPKANIFLQALEEREHALGLIKDDSRLSALMGESIEDRSAWFMLACRKVASVDLIYWDLLDEYCWGPRSSMADRAHAFTGLGEMHRGREDFVRLKIQQLREYYDELGEETDPYNGINRPFLGEVVTGLTFGLSIAIFLHRSRR